MYGTKFSGWTSQQNIESTLLAQGNGARAVIYGTDGATGHVWNAVVQNGKVNYIDGQIGGSGASNFKAFTNFQFGILP
jgi:filamentous hemagglutinin